MQVEIRKIPALRVGTVRHISPYIQINEGFARLGELAAPARLFERPGAQMVALFYDDPDTTPADQLPIRTPAVVVPTGAAPTEGARGAADRRQVYARPQSAPCGPERGRSATRGRGSWASGCRRADDG